MIAVKITVNRAQKLFKERIYMPPVIRPRRTVTIDDQREVARPRPVTRSPAGRRSTTASPASTTSSPNRSATAYSRMKAVADVALPGMNRTTMQMEMFEGETVTRVRGRSPAQTAAFLRAQVEDNDELSARYGRKNSNKQDGDTMPVPIGNMSGLAWEEYRRGERDSWGVRSGDDTARTVVLFFAGSMGNDPHARGPEPEDQTPVWVDGRVFQIDEIAEYVGTLFASDGTTVITPAKTRQVEQITGDYSIDNIILIGYSGGGDSAIMWANQYISNPANTGRITDLVLLGPTVSGTMPDKRQLIDYWQQILGNLVAGGTDVLLLDDAAQGDQNWYSVIQPTNPGAGTYYVDVQTDRNHIETALPGNAGTGTNNDPTLVQEIWNWIMQN
jgi:pimeloyl-ACP methyl ester carboxylesterase